MNVEVIGLASMAYDEIIAKRIADVGFLELPFKSYQSFVDTHTGATKFSVSCQSLDRIWAVHRTAGYDTQGEMQVIDGYKVSGQFGASASGGGVTVDFGKPDYELGGVLRTNGEKMTTKFLNFTLTPAAAGPAKFQFQLNGSFFPQFQATEEEMYAISKNSVDYPMDPTMTLAQYKANYFVQCIRLCLPDSDTREISGLDTRGINMSGSYNTTNVTRDTNVVLFCEHTSTLRVGANRQIEVVQ